MLSVQEAVDLVLANASRLPSEARQLSEAVGRVLDEPVYADRDLPPFDKALLDGFAVRSDDFGGDLSSVELEVIEEITAGETPTLALGPGQSAAIMTGAPMPEGADAVVMVEQSERIGNRVSLRPAKPVVSGYGRLERGREMRQGELLFRPGTRLNSVQIGLLASVGHARPLVVPPPEVTVVSTGDEIVPPDKVPGPGQIRNSNASILSTFVQTSGATAIPEPIAPDDPGILRSILTKGLDRDILLITGGVSAGKKDLVPGILEELGVRPIFHRIRLKPGKPLLFGLGPTRSGGRPGTLVFGLPGNPVSGVVGFLLFVTPALRTLQGFADPILPLETTSLAESFQQRGDRPTYHPSNLESEGNQLRVRPRPWAGSADLRTVALADGFAVFEAGERLYQPGEEVPFLRLPTLG